MTVYDLSINDIGIIIEIIGFGLFLISAKALPRIGTGMDYNGENESAVKINKYWKRAWPELPGHFGQISRVIAIPLIIGGLVLQFDLLRAFFAIQ